MKTLLAFKKYLDGGRYSPSSIDGYYKDADKFLSFFNRKKKLQFTQDDTNKYIQYLKKSKYKTATILRAISSLRELNKFLQSNKLGWIEFRSIYDFHREKKHHEYLTRPQVIRLLNSFGERPLEVRNKLMIAIIVYTGAKVTDLANLRVDDYNSRNGELSLPMGIVKLPNSIVKDVNSYLLFSRDEISPLSNTYFFPSKKGKSMSRKSIWRLIDGQSAHVLNYKVTPMILRHTYIHNRLSAGASLKDIQMDLDISDISTLSGYVKK